MADTSTRRPLGSGYVYETPSGLWRGRFVVTDPVTRRKARRYVSGPTRTKAERNLRDAIEASHRETAQADSPTLEWWATRWLDTVVHRVRPATIRSYRQTMKVHVIPALGAWPLADLRPGDVERWTADMQIRGLAPSTVALCRRVLAACLADAERDGRAPRNAARLAHAPSRGHDPPTGADPSRSPRLAGPRTRRSRCWTARDAGPGHRRSRW